MPKNRSPIGPVDNSASGGDNGRPTCPVCQETIPEKLLPDHITTEHGQGRDDA